MNGKGTYNYLFMSGDNKNKALFGLAYCKCFKAKYSFKIFLMCLDKFKNHF